jgi:SAM-dependent methyltransferase
MSDKAQHWEKVYATKQPHEVSWTQERPAISLDFIHSFQLPRNARIIDIGGGDSRLADHLLAEGFEDITVLDISAEALARARERLGDKASRVKWLVQDITGFKPEAAYDLWHDRATFHFLVNAGEVNAYLAAARQGVKTGGFALIGTFSDDGPDKCSGLPVRQYSEETLSAAVENGFRKIRCVREDHVTPFNTRQNFLFCAFRRS